MSSDCGEFGLGRLAAVLLLEAVDRRLDAAHVAAQAARQPVVLAQAVEHGAADALRGVGLELRAEPLFVAPERIEQAHHAVLDQVVHVHAGRQLGHELEGDALDQGSVGLDEVGLVELTVCVVHPFGLYRLAAQAPACAGSGDRRRRLSRSVAGITSGIIHTHRAVIHARRRAPGPCRPPCA